MPNCHRPAPARLGTLKGKVTVKALGQSVHTLLGGYRDRAPTYASGALMRPHPVAYLAEAGPRLVQMGFKQMKTQMGAEPTVQGITADRDRDWINARRRAGASPKTIANY